MLRLEFVEPAEAIAVWLGQQAHVRLSRTDGQHLELGFSGPASAQAALVAACVAAGHQLVSLAPITENLQQSYLKSLAAERATEAAESSTRSKP
jgi:hypothetical protein